MNIRELTKKTARGMRDISPKEAYIREKLLSEIKYSYRKSGYNLIETPSIENIQNLLSNQGGENEKLIFKIMKRGDKLDNALSAADSSLSSDGISKQENNEFKEKLSDMGLRYDLTLPLSRYFANNQQYLPLPFKAMQIGDVWRADRPQKNRYRQFKQCDIDIIGDDSITAEIDLLYTTLSFLQNLPLSNLTLKINNRRLLFGLLEYCGFSDRDYATILIELDKIDKVGLEGVCDILKDIDCTFDSINKYKEISLSLSQCKAEDGIADILYNMFENNDNIILSIRNTIAIVKAVKQLISSDITVLFDTSLVRGMGYYTDTIYEIYCDESEVSAISGGGRYNGLIGKFSGQDIPACGISIGFERLANILSDSKEYYDKYSAKRFAVLYDKNISVKDFVELEEKAKIMRNTSECVVSLVRKNKNVKNQINMFESMGYMVCKNIEQLLLE